MPLLVFITQGNNILLVEGKEIVVTKSCQRPGTEGRVLRYMRSWGEHRH